MMASRQELVVDVGAEVCMKESLIWWLSESSSDASLRAALPSLQPALYSELFCFYPRYFEC